MKAKVFYGWYIVGAGVLLSALFGGMTIYGFTAMVNPIATTLGWSYAQISLASSLRGVETGILSPFMGRAVDRWPAKRLILVGIAIIGIGYICLSRVNSLPMFYVSFMIVALGTPLGITMTPMTTVVRWFKRDVGKAIGLLAMGFGLGGLAVPLLVKIIDTYGWRTSLLFMAAVVWLIGIPLAFIFRNRPQDYGMFPDGKPPDKVKGTGRLQVQEFSLGVKQALKTRAFWQLGFAFMFQMAGLSTVTIHIMPYLTSLGIERSTAGMVAMLIPVVSLVVRFLYGWSADIFQKKYLSAVSATLMGIGLLLFSSINTDSFGLIVPFVIIFGLGLGGVTALRAPIIREYFGIKNFGTILGLLRIFTTIATVSISPLAGWMFDTRGTYHPIWLILSGVALIGAFSFLMAPLPSRPSPRSPAQ